MSLLETRELSAHYRDLQALFGVNTRLEDGDTLAIIGANGAGKSTYLKAVSGLIPGQPWSVVFDGKPVGALPASEIMRRGIALVPEGRRLFPSMTVEENLIIGRYGREKAGGWTLDRVYALFPHLKARRHQPSTTLSGGEQQMAAIGRALMSNPRVLMCDEISLGLAPIIIRDIYQALPRIKAEGTSVIIVEQDIQQAMKVADRLYCFQEGRISLAGGPSAFSREEIHAAYFGTRK
jgi:branched-chain amino acid transport system ATP-binding protein